MVPTVIVPVGMSMRIPPAFWKAASHNSIDGFACGLQYDVGSKITQVRFAIIVSR